MSNLVGALDTLLTNQDFTVRGDDSMRYYNRSNLTLLVQPNTHGRIELNNGNGTYSGSYLTFTLQGQVKSNVPERVFWNDLHELKSRFNQKYSRDGIEILRYSFIPLNGQEVKVTNLLIEYRKGTDQDKIAAAIADIQADLFELMGKYIEK